MLCNDCRQYVGVCHKQPIISLEPRQLDNGNATLSDFSTTSIVVSSPPSMRQQDQYSQIDLIAVLAGSHWRLYIFGCQTAHMEPARHSIIVSFSNNSFKLFNCASFTFFIAEILNLVFIFNLGHFEQITLHLNVM